MEYARCNIPSIKDESTVEAIAREFCSNGRKKQEALASIGYADSYATESGRGCEVVFSNVRVKQAISRIDAIQAQIGHRTVKNLDAMYQNAHDVAETMKNPNAMATNITGIARLYNMDQPADGDTTQPLSPEQRTAAMAAAKAATGPKLSKETG